jgi:hypothetical protein
LYATFINVFDVDFRLTEKFQYKAVPGDGHEKTHFLDKDENAGCP